VNDNGNVIKIFSKQRQSAHDFKAKLPDWSCAFLPAKYFPGKCFVNSLPSQKQKEKEDEHLKVNQIPVGLCVSSRRLHAGNAGPHSRPREKDLQGHGRRFYPDRF
jgi:hypothetical protein